MSASRRLSRLKRGSMVSDVPNTKVRRNNIKTPEQPNGDGKMVNAFTVLQWHEQRINVMEENIVGLSKKSQNDEVIIPLVETIEALEKKLELLSRGYDNLVEQIKNDKKEILLLEEKINRTVDEVDDIEEDTEEIKTQVKKELNTVKLNITEN